MGWDIFHELCAPHTSLGDARGVQQPHEHPQQTLDLTRVVTFQSAYPSRDAGEGPGGDSHSHHLTDHALPPQASSTPSTAAVGKATTGWCIETSVTTARSRSQSGGAVTSRNAPSPCRSSLFGPRCSHPSREGFGVALGAFLAACQREHHLKRLLHVHLPALAGGWLRSGVPAAAPVGSWGCRRGRCSVCSACRTAPTAPCTPNTAPGSALRRAGPAAACPAPHSGGQEPGPR